ncbi:MAG: hemolysin III family protein [Actinomycetota bacterium]|nr:hemolysin III family protein [Actinomycetota bacterium]
MRAAGLPDQGYGTTALPRPRFRGVLHLWSFFGAVIVGVVIVITRSGVAESLAAAIYAIGVCTMFGVSALFHRVEWGPEKMQSMLQLDKTGIYVMIACSFTPVVWIGVGGRFGITILIGVWAISLILIAGLWLPWNPPYGVITGTYIGIGSIAFLALPAMWSDISPTFVILILTGGVLFCGGSFLLALRMPDPWPDTFGYHEVWHLLVFVGSIIHYVAITSYVL